jgi:ribonuclease-3
MQKGLPDPLVTEQTDPLSPPTEPRHPTAAAVEKILGFEFANPGLAVRALTHSSYTNETAGEGENYERLEFFGDAVLDYLAAFWLYQHFPELPEGDLTRMRSALVRTETLAGLAQQLGLNRILRIGKGERLSGGEERATILCGVFEALIGAIALDRGVDAASAFLESFFEQESSRSVEQPSISDSKSLFQEKAQAMFGITPGYRVVELSGPDHDRRYTIEVVVGEKSYGVGTGNSKQTAAQDAARQALKIIDAEG